MNPLQQQQGVFKVGIVNDIDEAAVKARVMFADLDNLETAFIPVGQRKSRDDKDYWMPDVGEHVICLMDANAEDGVILCAIYSDADAPPVRDKNKRHVRFKDGTWLEYDRSTGHMEVNCVNTVTVQAAAQITLRAPNIVFDGEVWITKNLQVDKNIHADINIVATASVAAQDGRVLLEDHRHVDVAEGNDRSGPPG